MFIYFLLLRIVGYTYAFSQYIKLLDLIIPNYNKKMQRVPNLFISTDALHVSGCSSAHHQEHVTVHTASGIVNQYLKLYIQLRAPDDGRRNSLKNVQRL